ncbi:MAG: peptidyl-prolyl cis-trans isomerase, peptidylprolyl isomerase [Candidatus Nomurabacteria bacterium]|nr:peptidyl-prolyl cis-trans isomerase, peptidylprolyl isomerase [Candidatus Nomurabacteria bacterium]
MEQSKGMGAVAIIVLIIIIGGIYYYMRGDSSSASPQGDAYNTSQNTTNQPLTKNTTSSSTANIMPVPDNIKTAVITTNHGVIEIEFNNAAPNTVANFKKLASEKFYDGVRFHRVIKDFMIQTGDPNSKDTSKMDTWGQGGPGYKFADELTGSEKYTLGTVAMANSGPNTNGSQFFIVTANPSVALPPSYTVFAKVTKGIDVAEKIQNVKTTGSPNDRPLADVIIQKVELK